MLLAIVPTGGIAQSTGAPTVSGTAATIYRVDPGGTIAQVNSAVLYNVSTAEAVPAGALATVGLSENGHYYVQTWAAQASPGSVIHAAGTPYHRGF
jgi:hypothetical protein